MQAAVVGVYLLAAIVGGLAATTWHRLALAVPTVAVAAVAAVVAVAWWRFGQPMHRA